MNHKRGKISDIVDAARVTFEEGSRPFSLMALMCALQLHTSPSNIVDQSLPDEQSYYCNR